jgi:RecT family
MDMNTAVGLLNIKEDLLDEEVAKIETSSSMNECTPVKKTRKFTTEIKPFERLLASAAKKLGCTVRELDSWLNQIPNTPEAVQHNALRLITKHGLDSFNDEIAIHQYEDGHWQAFITIDGWSKLINEHPAFNGISFTESEELIDGVPAWMGCAIYRKDRVVPIEVKEYLSEIRTEHSIWKEMPRRMLRHRVIAQCVRLAFGVSVPELKKTIDNSQKIKSESKLTVSVNSSQKKMLLKYLKN